MALAGAQPAIASQILFGAGVYASGDAAIAGGSYGSIAAQSFSNANGTAATNFSSRSSATQAASTFARAAASAYASRAATGVLTTGQYTPGSATLTGSSSGTNVFFIDGSTYSGLYALSFAGIGSGAIVNIAGTSLTNFINITYGGLQADQVLFNFYEATTVSMDGMTLAGSLLAPNARVTLNGGSVAGSVVAASFVSGGTTIGGRGFVDRSASPVTAIPEPATWAMLLTGFALIGVALRRGRRRSTGKAAPPASA